MKLNPSQKNSKDTKKIQQSEYECEFCKKPFKKESSFISHVCEKKRRWLARDEKYVKLGFYAYDRFYLLSFKNSKKSRTLSDFIASTYYNGFTNFGKYLIAINAINHEGFIDFLIRHTVKLDEWCHDSYYEDWVRELGRKESPYQAVERNILLMQQWEKDTGEPWNDFFRKVNTNLATKWIISGRVSPWLLYSGFGDSLLSRMSDEQLDLVAALLSPAFWTKMIEKNIELVKEIQTILNEYGV